MLVEYVEDQPECGNSLLWKLYIDTTLTMEIPSPIHVRFRSGDFSSETSTRASTGSETSAGPTDTALGAGGESSGQNSGRGSSGSGGGLSAGAKIAIGVVVPVFVLAIVIAALVFWLKRRQRRPKADGSVVETVDDGRDDYPEVAENHHTRSRHRGLTSTTAAPIAQELQSDGHNEVAKKYPSEMHGIRLPHEMAPNTITPDRSSAIPPTGHPTELFNRPPISDGLEVSPVDGLIPVEHQVGRRPVGAPPPTYPGVYDDRADLEAQLARVRQERESLRLEQLSRQEAELEQRLRALNR